MSNVIGVVGSEAAKFTRETEARARAAIRDVIRDAAKVISGGCHLGGIDIWAIEEAKRMGLQTQEFIPFRRQWSGLGGYADRNLKIATMADEVVCITVKVLPTGYRGMRFEYCYHCRTSDHIKSGGCWTVKQAEARGKTGRVIVIA